MTSGNIKEVFFDEDVHKYTYHGKELNGITSIISRRLNKNFPEDNIRVELVRNYGSQVHKESELWINEGIKPVSESGKWIVEKLEEGVYTTTKAELRVSDFETTASNIDIVRINEFGVATLIDIKTGNFDRQYCTMQLNAYRLMFENCYPFKVSDLKVFCTKTKRVYTILNMNDKDVLELLAANGGK